MDCLSYLNLQSAYKDDVVKRLFSSCILVLEDLALRNDLRHHERFKCVLVRKMRFSPFDMSVRESFCL